MSQQSSGATPGRRPRRLWFDPRFAIGLVLVAASVAGSVALVAVNDSSIRVFAVQETATPGQVLGPTDLVAVNVRMTGAESLYLTPAVLPEEGVMVTRTIAAGELVPRAAVGRSTSLDTTSVVLQLTSALPQSVEAGAVLDVWSARRVGSGEFEPPAVIVPAATVVRIVADDQLLSSDSGTSVEVLVPRAAVASVLESVANGAALSAVPVDVPLAR